MVPLLHQGGFERICVLTGRLLQEKCEVCLVVFSTKDQFYDVTGMELINLNLESRPGKLGKIVNVLKRVRAVKKIKREKQIQVTYSFGSTANLINVLSRVKDKIWVGIRGYGALTERAMKLFYKRADRVICCAKVMADDIEKQFHGGKSVCLYNPCDITQIKKLAEEPMAEAFQPFFADGRQVIASMSREDDVKGFWHLIKAFSRIHGKLPDTRLVIIGEGTFTEYKKLAKDLDIENEVLFAGLQKNPFCMLKKASLYILTSDTEGFPNALVEAMAAGVPALSVNCKTGPAEILAEEYAKAEDQHAVYEGEYGVLMPILNPEKNLLADIIEDEEQVIAEVAIKILTSPEKMTEMSRQAAARSKKFSMDEYTEQLLRLIEE